MMMERAKTAPSAPEETTTTEKKNTSETTTSLTTSTALSSAEERVQDLERRLNDLGGGSVSSSANVVSTTTTSKPSASAVTPQTGKNNPLLVSKDIETFYNCPLSNQLLHLDNAMTNRTTPPKHLTVPYIFVLTSAFQSSKWGSLGIYMHYK